MKREPLERPGFPRRLRRPSPLASRRGSMLLEAIFALLLLGVVALATLALMAQSLAHFEVAESRGRALPVAGSWLEAGAGADGHDDTLAVVPAAPVVPVGSGELRRGPDGGIEFVHPRVGRWPVPAPVKPAEGPAAGGMP
ncbi:MAG: hypothetical protein EA350_14530 [Gemmatimonadales bacterium]|nr:MAG: hypothetical protein EA350_14530 [Gemmatimonadales bacterium]